MTLHDWRRWARPGQLLPDDAAVGYPWRVWLVLAGRGWGKTRTGAEAVRSVVEGGYGARLGVAGRWGGRIALVAPTAADARDTMVEGESGLLAVFPPGERPEYEPSKRRVTFANGARAYLYSAEEPERLRGPQHGFAWCDELRAWKYPQDTWDNLQFGLRLGTDPRAVVTTTPKPIKLLRSLVAREGKDVVVTRGITYENAANLAPSQLAYLRDQYEGTTIGRQELRAVLLDEDPGALWTRALLDGCRAAVPEELTRTCIGVDPSVGDGVRADGRPGDACGIIGAGRDAAGTGYVLRDATVRGSPRTWAAAVVRQFVRLGANHVVAEGNQGGQLVREVIESVAKEQGVVVPVRIVHASRGKAARAEPVVARYEQGKVKHASGVDLGALEDELVTWVPGGPSPNRLDALVWALTDLVVTGGGEASAEVF